MSHLSHDQLWIHAGSEDNELERAHARGHLAGCEACQSTLEEIRVARGALALALEPPVPELPRAVALRVGDALAERADARSVRSVRSWFAALFTPRLAFALATMLAVLLGAAWWLRTPAPEHAQPDQVAVRPDAPPAPVLPPPSALPAPPLPPPRHLTASITSASKARAQNGPAAKAQVLEQGASVVTERGGSAWLKLPDGSRAGLTSASSLTLATLEQAKLTLELQKGSVAMEVPHRADRLLTVQAGEVLITDLGTRFVVSRNESRVLVAVQEGAVDVATPGGKQTVKAGHAVAWHDGTLDALAWEPGPVASAPAATAGTSPSKLREEDEPEATPPLEAEPEPEEEPVRVAPPPSAAPEEWALPRGLTARDTSRDPNRVLLPPVNVPRPKRRLSLLELETKLDQLSRVFAGATMREGRVRSIAHAADVGDCAHAIPMADAWLHEPPTGFAEETRWRRVVLSQKLRCFERQGRAAEAMEIKRLLSQP